MNFNISRKSDYELQGRMTNEVINLYGIEIKFLVVEKINTDFDVFGDFSHIKADNKKIFTVHVMPESSEEYNNLMYSFTQFGAQTSNAVNLFISKYTLEKIFPNLYKNNTFKDVLSNLIVLPNGGIVEITDCQYEVPGVSNLYLNNDLKNIFKLSCITYKHKQENEIPAILATQDNFGTLNDYFDELTSEQEKQDDLIELTGKIYENKPLVQEIDSVFGRF